ncbi:hypothetical protein B0H11DRAFT_1918717 [Mycena galericulata]|nr:hypothetical protein B0H11DRAFT_1918717 [Mycena galericulata]
MDVDPDIPNDNGDRGGNHRSSSAKVRIVNGPDREEYDKALATAAYHRDQAVNAREQRTKIAVENQQLYAQLEAAEKKKAEQIAKVNSLHEELASKSKAIEEMQQHEGQMEAQFLGDQAKLQEMYHHCNTMVPQLLESQKLLLQRNEEVERLNRLLAQKRDETIQLRAYPHLQGKKSPQKNPPPRRGTRVSLAAAHNSSTRTIQIPLNPIPVTGAPSGTSNPTVKAKLTTTPAFADLLGTDVNTLSELIGKIEQLLVSDDVTVSVEKVEKTTAKKGKKSKRRPSKALMNHIHQVADFQIYNPADAAQVAACEDGLADPADDLFQWYFGPGYIQSRWNDLMIGKIVDAALKDDGEDGEIAQSGIERDFLEAVMVDKLESYRAAWQGFQPRFVEHLDRVETRQEARARGAQAFEQHQLDSRSTSSKHRKYEDRVGTITATIEIKSGERNAGDIKTWERLLEMIEHLGEQGMSSEEEDEIEMDDIKVRIFRVKLCVWREPRVVEYVRFVDAQTALFKKKQRGPIPASRIRSDTPGSSKAPCGLPKSLYNGEWLKKSTPAYLKELKVSKEEFGLFVAAPERMAL